MKNPGEIWRQRLWIWLPALLFFLANAAAFSVYRFGYAGRVESLEVRLDEQKTEMQRLEARRKELETLVNRVRTNDLQVRQLYAERFSTRSQRMVPVTAEIRRLASQSGLRPRAISYPEEEIEEYGLVKRSLTFAVDGTYAELRKFINLLELSSSFLAVEDISLTGGGEEGPDLKISIRISTYFATDAAPVPVAARAEDGAETAEDGAERRPS